MLGFVGVAAPAATDGASEALLANGDSSHVSAAASTAPATAAPAAATAITAAPVPTSLPVSAPAATTATDIDLFGGQCRWRVGCRSFCFFSSFSRSVRFMVLLKVLSSLNC